MGFSFSFPILIISPNFSFMKNQSKMENECKWDQSALISELKQGMELANQLNLHLNLPSSSPIANGSQQLLLQRILSTYDNALFILQWRKNNQINQQQLPPTPTPTPPPPPPPPAPVLLESCSSPEISPRLQKSPPASKKRKASSFSTWTNNVTVRSENGLELPCEDGHSWRKYGQKDILGAKYPRSYYRCTYRNVQNCWATKQVQRSDEDPTLFDINYKGKHTCTMRNPFQSSTSSSPRTPQKQTNNNNNNHDNEKLLSLRKNLRVDTNINIDNVNTTTSQSDFSSTSFDQISLDYTFSSFFDDNLLGGYSPKFLSPANSDSNYYFSGISSERNGFGADIISNNSSVSNSPVVGLDFSNDRIGLGDFEFDNSGFFR